MHRAWTLHIAAASCSCASNVHWVWLAVVHHRRKETGVHLSNEQQLQQQKRKQSTWIENNWCALHECDDQWSWFVDCLPLGLCDCMQFRCVSLALSSVNTQHIHISNRFHITLCFVVAHSFLCVHCASVQLSAIEEICQSMWVAWNNCRKLAWIIEYNTCTINRHAETCIAPTKHVCVCLSVNHRNKNLNKTIPSFQVRWIVCMISLIIGRTRNWLNLTVPLWIYLGTVIMAF